MFRKKNAVVADTAPRVISLGNSELLVRTQRGFYVVCPGWNIDVALGIIRDGIIEPWTNAVFASLLRPGNSVVNVGANFGYYAALAAQHVGRQGKVYAVEANPVVFPFLVKTAFWSGFPDVLSLFNCAAASPAMHQKNIDFHFDPQFIGGGNLFGGPDIRVAEMNACFWSPGNLEQILDENRQFVCRGIYSKVTATCRTLDSLLPADARIDAMLIDAEGSECYVIEGAQATIRRNPRMALVVEWAPCNYTNDPARRPSFDAMWNFLLDEMKFSPQRICPEGYAGPDALPTLQKLTREQLFQVPHSDILLTP